MHKQNPTDFSKMKNTFVRIKHFYCIAHYKWIATLLLQTSSGITVELPT